MKKLWLFLLTGCFNSYDPKVTNGAVGEGAIVEQEVETLQADNDGDGFTTDDGDCDDDDATINPNAIETCDGYDNNCNQQIDEGVMETWWQDTDIDGYGAPENPYYGCERPPGYVSNDDDCDDTDPLLNPDTPEICNTVDDNCNGLVDEGLDAVFWPDLDGDGFGDAYLAESSCLPKDGYVEKWTVSQRG